MPKGKGAVVVVACVAGFGAWGASVSVANGSNTYASELFGAGHATLNHPEDSVPRVVLNFPANTGAVTARTATDGVIACPAVPARSKDTGAGEVTFRLLAGTFGANISAVMYDVDGPDRNGFGQTGTAADNICTVTDSGDDLGCTDAVAAPASVASIVAGGRTGDNYITIKVEEGSISDSTKRPTAAVAAARSSNTLTCDLNIGETESGENVVGANHQLYFDLPKLNGLESLGGANALDADKGNDVKTAWFTASSRVISGAFSDGPLTGAFPYYVVSALNARDSLTLEISDDNEKTILIDGDSAFKGIKETIAAGKAGAGYVELATVTVAAKQVMTPGMAAAAEKIAYYIDTDAKDGDDSGTALEKEQAVFTPARGATGATYYTIYGLDGEEIDYGLRGTLMVNAMGMRDLFNDGDELFIDYDKNGKMGPGEGLAISGAAAAGTALSIDADKSESFDAAGKGEFKVYYKPGGKDSINHGASIKLTADVNYSDPTAIDEAQVDTESTLNFKGVDSDVMAYAIPHSTNGTGDKANVRVRCEASAGCRVFVECWDDAGMRSFGEAGMIDGNALMKWDAAAIEGVIGVTEPTSRHSCRILSAGMVSVQQLTRDGNSKTLVNNTYVGQ